MPASSTSSTINYGSQFAIAASKEPGDRKRVSARSIDLAESLPRYAVFGAGSNESIWRILDGEGRESEDGEPGGPVKFGDVITLGVAASMEGDTQTIYLSCRDVRANSRKVGLVEVPLEWEKWTIVNPAALDSTQAVALGSTFALRSHSSDYLSRAPSSENAYVLQTRPAISQHETWIVSPPVITDPRLLRHGRWISVVRTDKGEDKSSHLSAANNAPDDVTLTAPAAAHFGRAALSELSRWLVERTDGSDALPISYGDTIYLGIRTYNDPAQPKARYLQYFPYQPQSGGGFKVGVAPQSGGRDWEKWKVVNPNSQTSTARVGYGDKFALKGLSGEGQYLSCPTEPGGSPPVATAVTSATLGTAATFTLTDPVAERPGTVQGPHGVDWRDSAALLEVGKNMAKLGVMTAAKQIPYGGGAAAGVIDMFWTENGPNIWDLIKEQVKALVRTMIDADHLKMLQGHVDDVKDAYQNFVTQRSDETRKAALIQLLSVAAEPLGDAKRLSEVNPQQALPYFAALGTIHLAALSEEFINFKTYYPKGTASEITTRRQKLKAVIADYSERMRKGKEAALSWRKGLIVDARYAVNSHMRRDEYLAGRVAIMMYDEANYTREVTRIFESQLDAAIQSWLLWRYMDPDVDDMPTRKTATFITGPYGRFGDGESNNAFGGSFFWDAPGNNLTLSEIRTHAGDAIYSLSVTGMSPDGWPIESKLLNSESAHNALALQSGERFVSAWGNAGWECHSLNLKTNRMRNFNAGTRHGDEWSANLPDDTHPYLVGISGSTGDRLCQVYLNWNYERWE